MVIVPKNKSKTETSVTLFSFLLIYLLIITDYTNACIIRVNKDLYEETGDIYFYSNTLYYNITHTFSTDVFYALPAAILFCDMLQFLHVLTTERTHLLPH